LEPAKPPNEYRLCECLRCATVAHYRLAYTIEKNAIGEPTCRACFWTAWSQEAVAMARVPAQVLAVEEVSAAAVEHGFEYLGPLTSRLWSGDPHLTRCLTCGKLEAQRLGDIDFGCPCRTNRRVASTPADRGKKDLFKLSGIAAVKRWDHERNDPTLFETLTVRARTVVWWTCASCGEPFQAAVCNAPHEIDCPACTERGRAVRATEWERMKATPVAAVSELLAAWEDDADPAAVMVASGRLHLFRCPEGHHPRVTPSTFLRSGCPHCQAAETRSTGRANHSIESHAPEIASQWHPTRNGNLELEQIGINSVRRVWWLDPVCGHEWEETVRNRDKYERLRCPTCRTILDSLTWRYPELAAEWADSNPVSAWHVRPFGKTRFMPSWVCSADPLHVWTATLGSRSSGSDCPECRVAGKSAVELAYGKVAAAVFASVRSGPIVRHESFRRRPSWSIDILVAEQDGLPPLALEYDGAFWHQSEAKRAVDIGKTHDLLDAGYLVARLREHPLPPLGIDHQRYSEFVVYPTAPDPEAVMRQVSNWRETIAEAHATPS